MLVMSKTVSLLTMLCVSVTVRVAPAPICSLGHPGCQAISLADLFDRVIQHSSRMHGLSSELHAEFDEELTEVILKLLLAWGEPLALFHESMTQQQDYNIYSSNKALEMSDMVYELKNGVQKVAEKMQLLGIISNLLNRQDFLEGPDAGDNSESFSVDNPNLLHCFRRDSDKIQNYLKILKCRILPENGC